MTGPLVGSEWRWEWAGGSTSPEIELVTLHLAPPQAPHTSTRSPLQTQWLQSTDFEGK